MGRRIQDSPCRTGRVGREIELEWEIDQPVDPFEGQLVGRRVLTRKDIYMENRNLDKCALMSFIEHSYDFPSTL